MSCHRKFSNLRGNRNPQFGTKSATSMGKPSTQGPPACNWHLKWGQSCGLSPSTAGADSNFRETVSGVNCKTPSWRVKTTGHNCFRVLVKNRFRISTGDFHVSAHQLNHNRSSKTIWIIMLKIKKTYLLFVQIHTILWWLIFFWGSQRQHS